MDATIQIWIGESIDSLSPNKTCNPGEICNLNISAIAGKVYKVYITATKSASNIINVTSFLLSSTQSLYHEIGVQPFAKNYCTGYLSFRNVYKCNAIDSENLYYSALIPKYCSNYAWSGDVFSCTSCITNSHLENGLCICDSGYAENHITGECVLTSYKVEINLYTNYDSEFDTALLIITNPCTQVDNNFFCKETGSFNLLYKAIITEFIHKHDLILSAYTYLLEGSYSITINYLKSGGLVRECWSGYEYKGYRSTSDIGNFSIPSGMNVCVYEGYIKAPVNLIKIYVKVDDICFIWIGDYSNMFNIIILSTNTFT
jgi:hypothetical protein